MKVFYESKYKYTGIKDGYHSFTSTQFTGLDTEVILVKQAKLIKVSGDVQFFDPPRTIKEWKRVGEYQSVIDEFYQRAEAKRVRLTNQTKFSHTPK